MAHGDGIRHEIEYAMGQIHDANRWEEEGYLKKIFDEISRLERRIDRAGALASQNASHNMIIEALKGDG